jgi:acetate kinase
VAHVLIVNVGSSSFKWSALAEDGRVTASGDAPWTPSVEAAAEQVDRVLSRTGPPEAVGHRMVHGGSRFPGPVCVDPDVRSALESLRPLATRHMTAALACVDAVSRVLPHVPQVCAFDTSFHADMPEAARTYAVPEEWRQPLALRRYGFHGLSLEWAVARTGELLGALPPRIVVCHLGSGCSVTAVREGRSADTTMGYTPLDGVVMGTRAGQLDPGAVLAIADFLKVEPRALELRLETECGLRALAGTPDLKQVMDAAGRGEPRAVRAYAVYLHALVRAVGGAAGVLGGVDALVFTGGAGEHSAQLRADVCRAMAHLGTALDSRLNTAPEGDVDLAQLGAPVRILRIVAREDLRVLDAIRRVLDAR